MAETKGVVAENVKNAIFPPNFLWGAAVASYQVEGGNSWSDWWEWEQTPGHIADGSRNTVGCDFWNKYEYYLDLAQKISLNAFRLSIEWGRINPEKCRWSDEALKRYQHIIMACRDRGIEPMVTLWHFTLPQWVSNEGGWVNPDTVNRFLLYAGKAVEALGNDVSFWITLNEPRIFLGEVYSDGTWPPGKKNDGLGFRQARKNLITAHREIFAYIKKKIPKTQVGISVNIPYNEPCRAWYPLDYIPVLLANRRDDYGFLKSIQPDFDFVGLNYYFHHRLAFCPNKHLSVTKNENKIVSDVGWEVYPAGLAKVVGDLWRRFRKPIFVTENGVADAKDVLRSDFIQQHLFYLAQAIVKGADVRGYLHWSLMDNFEWSYGFAYRSGLYEMDYENITAILRPSGKVYSQIIAGNRVII